MNEFLLKKLQAKCNCIPVQIWSDFQPERCRIQSWTKWLLCLLYSEGLLADKNNLPVEEEEDEGNLNYNPPTQKSLQEIQQMDKDDESLVKYKQTLLGPEAVTAGGRFGLPGQRWQRTRCQWAWQWIWYQFSLQTSLSFTHTYTADLLHQHLQSRRRVLISVK